jgi:hypothetical protein
MTRARRTEPDLAMLARPLLAGALAPPLADEAFVARVMARIAREAEKIQARVAAFQWTLGVALVLLVATNVRSLAAEASLGLVRFADALEPAAQAAPLLGVAAIAAAAWLLTERA